MNRYFSDYGEFSGYSSWLPPYDHLPVNQDSNSTAFSNIDYLPKRSYEMVLYGLEEYCRFNTAYEPGCNLWSAGLGDGHFTFLGWQWESA